MTLYWLKPEVTREPHPSTAWAKLSWKTWKFTYWDREAKEEKELKVPEEFIVVAEWMWVQWFVDVWYWSNEIFSSTDEAIQIRAQDTNKVKFEWAWKDIKDKVKAFWLPLWKHIHFVEPGSEEIKTLKIKGKAWVKWSDFLNDNRFAPWDFRIKIAKMEKEKNWAVTYFVPVFDKGSALSDEDRALQAKVASVIWNWHDNNKIWLDEIADVEEPVDDNELPF